MSNQDRFLGRGLNSHTKQTRVPKAWKQTYRCHFVKSSSKSYTIVLLLIITFATKLSAMPFRRRSNSVQGYFQPGNQLWKNRTTSREEAEEGVVPVETPTVTDDGPNAITAPVAGTSTAEQDDKAGSTEPVSEKKYNLRSSASCQKETEEAKREKCVKNRLVDMNRVLDLFNNAIQDHNVFNSDHLPTFTFGTEEKWGVAWKASLTCTQCPYRTEKQKLYAEVDTGRRGPKPAESNIALAVASQNTSIGPTKVRTLLSAGLNMPVPTKSVLQSTTKLVSKKTAELNEKDMANYVQQVRDEDGIINNISFDAQYNSANRSNRRKFGQAASQAVGTAIETDSREKKIIGLSIQNKLCAVGSRLKAQGVDVKCPGVDHECTANLPEMEPLSEFVMGEEIGRKLAATGTRVRHVTSDGDARGAKGILAGLQELFPDWDVERLADPGHLHGTMKTHMYSHVTFSESMFPHCRTKTAHAEARKHLINDLVARSTQIVKRTHEACGEDAAEFCKQLPLNMDIAIQCYQGDHSGCKETWKISMCKGTEEDNWIIKSKSLGLNGIKTLKPTEEDVRQMVTACNITLGPDAAVKLRLGTDTQKNEGFNRAITARAPKNVNFSTTLPGRVHTAALAVNHGEGEALRMALENVGVSISGETSEYLDTKQKQSEYHKKYSASGARKKQLRKSRDRKREEYINRRKGTAARGDYDKHQLDLAVPTGEKV